MSHSTKPVRRRLSKGGYICLLDAAARDRGALESAIEESGGVEGFMGRVLHHVPAVGEPLSGFIVRNDQAGFDWMLDKGFKPCFGGEPNGPVGERSAVMTAARSQPHFIGELVRRFGPSMLELENAHGETVLLRAVKERNFPTVLALLEMEPALLERRNSRGLTPLAYIEEFARSDPAVVQVMEASLDFLRRLHAQKLARQALDFLADGGADALARERPAIIARG